MTPEAMRGLIVVIAATLVGLLVLGVGFDDPSPTTTAVVEPTPTPEPVVVPTAEPTPPAVDPATVDVLVANATSTTGLAGSVSTQLAQNFGYRTAEPANASPAPADGRTIVYFAPGAEAAAQGVAQILGLARSQVQPLPADPPVTVDLTDIEVVVILADDLVPAGG